MEVVGKEGRKEEVGQKEKKTEGKKREREVLRTVHKDRGEKGSRK